VKISDSDGNLKAKHKYKGVFVFSRTSSGPVLNI